MVRLSETFLQQITLLAKDGYVTVDATDAILWNLAGTIFNAKSSVPGGTPDPNTFTLWARDDGYFVYTDDNGIDHVLSQGGGGTSNLTAPLDPTEDTRVAYGSGGDLVYAPGVRAVNSGNSLGVGTGTLPSSGTMRVDEGFTLYAFTSSADKQLLDITSSILTIGEPGLTKVIVDTDLDVLGDGYVQGKLTVLGLIDPTGVVLDVQASTPGGTPSVGKSTLWVNSADGKGMLTSSGGLNSIIASSPEFFTTASFVNVGTDNGVPSSGGNAFFGAGIGVAIPGGGANLIAGISTAPLLDSGSANVVLGTSAAGSLVSGSSNTIIGNAAAPLLTGGPNIIVGVGAGSSMTTAGGANIVIGTTASTFVSGSACTLIGSAADTPAAGTSSYVNIDGLITGSKVLKHVAIAASDISLVTSTGTQKSQVGLYSLSGNTPVMGLIVDIDGYTADFYVTSLASPNLNSVDDTIDYSIVGNPGDVAIRIGADGYASIYQHRGTSADDTSWRDTRGPQSNIFAAEDFGLLSSDFPSGLGGGGASAGIQTDTNNSGLVVATFDDGYEEGVEFKLSVPIWATNVVFKAWIRPESSSSATTVLSIFSRSFSNDAAIGSWSSRTQFPNLTFTANENWRILTTSGLPSDFNLTPGALHQFFLTRDITEPNDTLSGDLDLVMFEVTFE